MTPTVGQAKVLQAVRDLQKTHPDGGGLGQVVGYAGTGKTFGLQLLDQEFDGLRVLTPTGKAAVRCREFGLEAQTIHSFIYKAEEDEKTGDVRFVRKLTADIGCSTDLLVVDEASMLSEDVFHDLWEFCQGVGKNLVLVGDGFQLPPVEKDQNKKKFCALSPELRPDFRVELKEIVRQAADNPIIQASLALRTERFPDEALSRLPVVARKDLEAEAEAVWSNGGIVICHRNVTRHQLNSAVRKRLGFPLTQVVAGEPLMVTQNNRQLDIYNGEVSNLTSAPRILNDYPYAVRDNYKNSSAYVDFYVVDLAGLSRQALIADKEVFGRLDNIGGSALKYAAKKLLKAHGAGKSRDGLPVFLQANLGYVATAHKAQGSEWNDVLVCLEPSVRLHEEEGRRWAYTAVTRSKNRIKICWM